MLLQCEINKQVWILILRSLGYTHSCFITWTSFIEWLSLRDSTALLILKKIVAHATIYSI
uniref:Uncharacterized protein n=1 Tax=Brassica campestris TaxID=3711 RepID=A0A3P6CML9_BRACM|nr:unnamed protein product [Brassica rapa]